MRLSLVAVTISSALRATGNQASGLPAATTDMGAITPPQRRSMRLEPRPSCARRALSKSANVR